MPKAAINDTVLSSFAEESSSRKVSVIVEAKDAAPTRVRVGNVRSRSRGVLPPPAAKRKASPESALSPQGGSKKQAMHKLQQDLQTLGLADKASRNDLVGAFVVDVTPSQLRELINMPSIRAIKLNRTYRRIA